MNDDDDVINSILSEINAVLKNKWLIINKCKNNKTNARTTTTGATTTNATTANDERVI